MTIEQIVSAIRALPVSDRLRVIEIVAHDAASEVGEMSRPPSLAGATLVEHKGLLVVDSEAAVPAAAFDHRVDRELRSDKLWHGCS